MRNRWDHQDVVAYGDTTSYDLAWWWLRDCALIEDWGCGPGWSKRYFNPGQWRGIDGSNGPLVDQVVDLTQYQTRVPGILLRHVLEHNLEWERVLDNALASFTQRMVLVLFTPMMPTTRTIAWNPAQGVPDIAFHHKDIEKRIPRGVYYEVQDLKTKTQYGTERMYYLEVGDGQEAEEDHT